MKTTIRRKLEKKKRKISRRLKRARKRRDAGHPVFRRSRALYEVSERTRAFSHGGIGAVHNLVLGTGLIGEMDSKLELLKLHRPYHESDHVLNIAYNVMCGGRTLEDLELLRNDESYLNLLGVAEFFAVQIILLALVPRAGDGWKREQDGQGHCGKEAHVVSLRGSSLR